ncbi:YbaK/EbsC family protein [Sediminimonas qiaohouensis]|uniref:YbaK/EbsC family protein n=1 Tax=Sediminimonas qiaohouensis TaxID=552061 RepID=UPI0009FCC85D
MAATTPAVRRLETLGIHFEILRHPFDGSQDELGLHAATALGIQPGALFKTLMITADRHPACAVLPVDRRLSMKALARHLGARRAALFPREGLLRQTGYNIGGISPIAQRRPCPVLFDASILSLTRICINGGKRGIVLRLAPQDALVATSGSTSHICIG